MLRIKLSTKLILGIGFSLILLLGLLFVFVEKRQDQLILREVEQRAEILSNQILLTRKWVADYRGVWVIQDDSKEISPDNMEQIVSARLVSELSQYAEKEQRYKFRLTSLQYKNPDNAPRDYEEEVLLTFKKGDIAFKEKVLEDGSPVFRYIVPLETRESCLSCHSDQGFQVGDINGALSIEIPMEETIKAASSGVWLYFTPAFIIIGIILTVLFFLLRFTVLKPIKAISRASKRLGEGDLSARLNLKTGDEFQQLSNIFNETAEKLSVAYGELSEMFLQTVEAISITLDGRDKYTAGHSQRVSEIAMLLGHKFGLREDELKRLRVSALLHDIGKMAVPDNILHKSGPLSEKEWDLMRSHPVEGLKIVRPIIELRDDPGIAMHHERVDGKGYPFGKKGAEIPLVAKIIGVADAFDAMTSDRKYRLKMTQAEAMEEIERYAGKQFDEDVANKLKEVYLQGDLPE